MMWRLIVRVVVGGALAGGLVGCNGIYLGDNPRKDVPKETGPLVVPPQSVRDGTARDL